MYLTRNESSLRTKKDSKSSQLWLPEGLGEDRLQRCWDSHHVEGNHPHPFILRYLGVMQCQLFSRNMHPEVFNYYTNLLAISRVQKDNLI